MIVYYISGETSVDEISHVHDPVLNLPEQDEICYYTLQHLAIYL